MRQPTDALTVTYRGEQAVSELERVRQEAEVQGLSLAELVRQVLKAWLKQQGGTGR